MKKGADLMPLATRQRLEIWRQGLAWSFSFLALLLLLVAGTQLFDQHNREIARALDAAEVEVQPLREAENQTRKMRARTVALRRQVENGRLLELTEAPLAILQVIIESCQRQGRGLRLDSLRLDEVDLLIIKDGSIRPPRKQLLLTGVADSDHSVTGLVHQLQARQIFQQVELLSSQGQSDLVDAQRSFSIRCVQ